MSRIDVLFRQMGIDTDLETEIAVVGGGPAGLIAAIECARVGSKVVVLERAQLGGVPAPESKEI